jgi:hypothetical protein
MPRFGVFIGAVKWAVGEGFLLRQVTPGGDAAAVAPLVLLLGSYLSATLRRLTALHARFVAGTLSAAPRKHSTVKSTIEDAIVERPKAERRAPGIPPGPVLLREFRVRFASHLQALLEEPEMRAFLAAAPRAGRILRPLWRKLTPEALPDMLRLPPRPRAPRPLRPARPAGASGPPGLRRVTLSDGTTAWEPKPCYPFDKPPPRRRRARASEPSWAPDPAPPLRPAAPPARPAQTEGPRVPPWVMGHFQR